MKPTLRSIGGKLLKDLEAANLLKQLIMGVVIIKEVDVIKFSFFQWHVLHTHSTFVVLCSII